MARNEPGADHLQHVATSRMEISGGGVRIDEMVQVEVRSDDAKDGWLDIINSKGGQIE